MIFHRSASCMSRYMSRAFTLVELLVAIAVFVGVVLIATMAVNDFSRAGREADQSLALHARHAAIVRELDATLGRAAGFAGLYLRQGDDGGDLVWMFGSERKAYTRDLRLLYLRTSAGQFGYYPRAFYKTKLFWAGLSWGGGRLRMGESMRQHWHDDRDTNEERFSHTRPTPQERMVHLFGRATDPAEPGKGARLGPLHVKIDTSIATNDHRVGGFTDEDGDGEERDEYGDWVHQVLDLGVFGDLSVEGDAYAVLNPDGRGVNKDWMYLAGSPDPDDNYHDQRLPIDTAIEFVEVTPYDRHGTEITTELDSLADGDDSFDWRGLPRYGRLDLADWNEGSRKYTAFDLDRRPARLRMRWLLHAIPMQRLDDGDLDGDGVLDESLAEAIRTVVLSDGSLTDLAQRREAFRALVREEGYAAEIFTHVAEMEL